MKTLTTNFVAIEDGDWISIRSEPNYDFAAIQLHKPELKLQPIALTKADKLNGLSWTGYVEIRCEAYREVEINDASIPQKTAAGQVAIPWQRWKDWTPAMAVCLFYCENGEWKMPSFTIAQKSYARPIKPLQTAMEDFILARRKGRDDATFIEHTKSDPAHPRPRPQVVKQQKTRPAIFTENKFDTSKIGPTSVDARWSNYGAYLQRLIDTVQVQWENILISGKIYSPAGSTVTVTFILDSAGKIARIVNVENKSSEQAAHACASAITDRAPYGPWTDDMIAMLGKQQEITFTFYYQ